MDPIYVVRFTFTVLRRHIFITNHKFIIMKSIVIKYDEADESLLLPLFEKLEIIIITAPKSATDASPMNIGDEENDAELTREQHMAGLIESINDVGRAMRGEIKLQSAYEVLAEMRAEDTKDMTTYERIMYSAKAIPDFCNNQGEAVDARIYRALDIHSRTFMRWKSNNFADVKRSDINAILKLLKCRYEDVFL